MDFDYDELLKEYSDDKPSKKESPAADDYEIRSFSEIQNERQRKVDDFKVNISSSDGEEKPAQNKGVYFSNPPRNIQNTVRKETAKNTTDKKLAVCAVASACTRAVVLDAVLLHTVWRIIAYDTVQG